MTLALEPWEVHSLRQGCNLYSKHFRICAITVNSVDKLRHLPLRLTKSVRKVFENSTSPTVRSMYFREREKPLIEADTFLALGGPKVLMALLIIFLNFLAILTLTRNAAGRRSNASSRRSSVDNKISTKLPYLPRTTQTLLLSLFLTYFLLGTLTLYSQLSLGSFVLFEYRFFENSQGTECLLVNSGLIALSSGSVSLHLLALVGDRLTASHLSSYSKYDALTKGTGTLPLCLSAIWLPSIILGSLPIAGWTSQPPFSFCIFAEQFAPEYLRFVAGFFLSILFLGIPILYANFLIFIRGRSGSGTLAPEGTAGAGGTIKTLYRWQRKLHQHHSLVFTSILVLNLLCWTPFQVYVLLLSSIQGGLGGSEGFLLEYLFVIALLPAIGVPLGFTLRSNILNQCALRVARGGNNENPYHHTNPLSQRSRGGLNKGGGGGGLFYITGKNNSLMSSSGASTGITTLNTSSTTLYKDTLSSKKGHFFVPRYLPSTEVVGLQQGTGGRYLKKNQIKSGTGSGRYMRTLRVLSRTLAPKQMIYSKILIPICILHYYRKNEAFNYKEDDEPIYANTTLKKPQQQLTETDSQCGFPIKKGTDNSSSRPLKAPRRQAPPLPKSQPPLKRREHDDDKNSSTILDIIDDYGDASDTHYYSTLNHQHPV
jgi:hypothetical protein